MSNETREKIFLITGAAGNTGGDLARYLLSQGDKIRVLVRNEQQAEKWRESGAQIAYGDLLNQDALLVATKGIYGIYHLAALFRPSGAKNQLFYQVNRDGTSNIFTAAIQNGVSRIVHCSTVGVISRTQNLPATEEEPYSPNDVYQRSKMEGEKVALNFFRAKKISGVVIRPTMIYSARDERILKLFKMIKQRKFFYVGKGDKWVHFIESSDLAIAFRKAMFAENLNGEIFHIAGREAKKLKEAVEIAANILRVPPPKLHLPVFLIRELGRLCELLCKPFGINPPLYRRRVDFFTKDRYFETSKAKKLLNFEGSLSFLEEFQKVISEAENAGKL
ncbi:MAG TPA: NAD-dependent epimerase/dehydratase family protein [Oligoflexia bacterium]|nr:NAD-dependent epimerase/dehydratase family protein [Oligoflexia bacterium]HMP26749.1 NAD-dependent epimerase/dehydratase family protein [Oligoflexia bacterium]